MEVQSAAIHALYNSLEFIRDNFEREVSIHRRTVIAELTSRASETTSCRSFARPHKAHLLPSRSARSNASSGSWACTTTRWSSTWSALCSA